MDIVHTVKSLGKIKPIKTDNLVFKLYYKLSTPLFTLCFIAVTVSQLFGIPIKCFGFYADPQLATTYCWNGNLYIIVNPHMLDYNNYNTQPQTLMQLKPTHTVRWLWVFRFIPMILGVHAIVMYVTHWIWKCKEGGLISRIVCPTKKGATQVEWNERKSAIVRLLAWGFGTHLGYATAFTILEYVNLLISCGSLLAMEWYLGAAHYGLYAVGWLTAVKFVEFDRLMFPETAKCAFPIGSHGGDVVNHDNYCVLGHSFMYRILFLCIWFWMMFVIFATILNLTARTISVFWLRYRVQRLQAIAPNCEMEIIQDLARKGNYGDYLVLSFVGQSMAAEEFSEVLISVHERLNAGTV